MDTTQNKRRPLHQEDYDLIRDIFGPSASICRANPLCARVKLGKHELHIRGKSPNTYEITVQTPETMQIKPTSGRFPAWPSTYTKNV